jgi:nucleoside-diphosphate-sugar epimerase
MRWNLSLGTFTLSHVCAMPVLVLTLHVQAGLVIHSRQPQHEREVFETNVTGTMNVMKAAKANKYVCVLFRISQLLASLMD